MKIIHIVGSQNSGKTTLVKELIEELTKKGLKVGAIKHSSHNHELDKKGKDSYIHRQAGANPAAIICEHLTGIFLPHSPGEDPLEKILPLYQNADIVIIEGHINGPGKKLEVFRKETATPLRALERDDIEAIITDDPVDTDLPVWPRKEVRQIVYNLCGLLDLL